MNDGYLVRRDFEDILPFLTAIRQEADRERDALGFLPEAAYEESARQRKLILLLSNRGNDFRYAGHLLFGGIFLTLRVRQVCVAPDLRQGGHATTLLRALISQAEKEGYLHIVANVAADLGAANLFYEKNGFVVTRLKPGGVTRNRQINVRILQLETPSLISLMVGPAPPKKLDFIQAKKRPAEIPIYAIDLNVFFDAIRGRERSVDAGAAIAAALRHQIRLAVSDEFVHELHRESHNRNEDPILSFAKQLPALGIQDKLTVEKLYPLVAAIVFPERSNSNRLQPSDKADISHLVHAIAAGASGYITSDSKILNARDVLMSNYGCDLIGLSEFVSLLEFPGSDAIDPPRKTKHFRIQKPALDDINSLLRAEHVNIDSFLQNTKLSECKGESIADEEGIVGVSLLAPAAGIDQASRTVVCVRQDHAFASTIADYLISEVVRQCTQRGPCNVVMLDIASHPITSRVASSQGFQRLKNDPSVLAKVALGRPTTPQSWNRIRLAVERVAALKLQTRCPRRGADRVQISSAEGELASISVLELETLFSPAMFALTKRTAVVVPITPRFASDLLGANRQYSFLEVPEAQFLSRRTYFNTVRAARAMVPGAIVAFYESGAGQRQGAIVALARIVDVTSVTVGSVSEKLRRGSVVHDLGQLTTADRILASTFDNLIPLDNPVGIARLRQIGCVTGANFVSATPISGHHLQAIVDTGFGDGS